MKVSDYRIVTAANPKKVANAVMAYLHDGWELFGTPFPAPEGIGPAHLPCEQVTDFVGNPAHRAGKPYSHQHG